MKKYKIVYQRGNDTLIEYVNAESKVRAQYLFYMGNREASDIISIEEVVE